MVAFTEGYPYFLQEYGKVLWDRARTTPITAIEAVEAQAIVEARLDGSFFRIRIERASELEVRYLRAMADLGTEPNARPTLPACSVGRRTGWVRALTADRQGFAVYAAVRLGRLHGSPIRPLHAPILPAC